MWRLGRDRESLPAGQHLYLVPGSYPVTMEFVWNVCMLIILRRQGDLFDLVGVSDLNKSPNDQCLWLVLSSYAHLHLIKYCLFIP